MLGDLNWWTEWYIISATVDRKHPHQAKLPLIWHHGRFDSCGRLTVMCYWFLHIFFGWSSWKSLTLVTDLRLWVIQEIAEAVPNWDLEASDLPWWYRDLIENATDHKKTTLYRNKYQKNLSPNTSSNQLSQQHQQATKSSNNTSKQPNLSTTPANNHISQNTSNQISLQH